MRTIINFVKNLFSSSATAKKSSDPKSSDDYAADIEDELNRPTNRGG